MEKWLPIQLRIGPTEKLQITNPPIWVCFFSCQQKLSAIMQKWKNGCYNSFLTMVLQKNSKLTEKKHRPKISVCASSHVNLEKLSVMTNSYGKMAVHFSIFA